MGQQVHTPRSAIHHMVAENETKWGELKFKMLLELE